MYLSISQYSSQPISGVKKKNNDAYTNNNFKENSCFISNFCGTFAGFFERFFRLIVMAITHFNNINRKYQLFKVS